MPSGLSIKFYVQIILGFPALEDKIPLKISFKVLACAVLVLLFQVSAASALPGDINSSGRVDGHDLIRLGLAYDSEPGDINWNPDGDLDKNGAVDTGDMGILSTYFGRRGVSFGLWVGTAGGPDNIHKFSRNGNLLLSISGFSNPVALVPVADGKAVWVVDADDAALVKVSSADGSRLITITGMADPRCAGVDTSDGSVWIADTGNNRVVKLLPGIIDDYTISDTTQSHIIVEGFDQPGSISVDPENESVWVADITGNRIVRLDTDISDGYDISINSDSHDSIAGFNSPESLAVDISDGSVWVADTGNNRIVKLSATNHTELLRLDGYTSPIRIRANAVDGSAWVTDRKADGRVIRIGPNGAALAVIEGLSQPVALSVDTPNGSCWTHDAAGAGDIVYLSPGGFEQNRVDAFSDIQCLAVIPDETTAAQYPTATAQLSDTLVNIGATVTLTGTGTDPDGTITKFEWDFNGDGVFDYSDAVTGTTPATYTEAGIYTPVFRVTDNDYFTATDYSRVLHVGLIAVDVDASPDQGASPLDVTLNAAVTGMAPGNTVVLYEWDFDGDGTYDDAGPASSEVTHRYSFSGTWIPAVRITDGLGNFAYGSVTVTVENSPPVAYNYASPAIGDLPLTVSLTGVAIDTDGAISLYEWDFDGEDPYDWSSETTGQTDFTYTTAGAYETRFRATDNGGLTATAVKTITVSDSQLAPTATAAADATEGYATFSVNFTGTGLDPDDGVLVLYEWDFDGDGTYDYNSPDTGITSYAYPSPGLFRAIFRVTDMDGLNDEDSLLITVKAGGTPIAVANANPVEGDVPLTVSFDAGGSSDPGGEIVLYEWIFGSPDVWIVDHGNDGIRKYDDDALYKTVSGFLKPYWVATDPNDGSVWVTDTSHDQVVKLSADGSGELKRVGGLDAPLGIAVTPSDGSVWVLDSMNDEVVKLDDQGLPLARTGGFDLPDGLVEALPYGEVLPHGLDVDTLDNGVWVADYHHHQIVKLSESGTELVRVSGFSYPTWAAVDNKDGSVWVADHVNDRVVKLLPGIPDGYHTNRSYTRDSSPFNHLSEIVGDIVEGAGALSGGLDMGGYDDYVRIPSNPALDVQSFTIEAWIKPGHTTARPIFMRGNNAGEKEVLFMLKNDNTLSAYIDNGTVIDFDGSADFTDGNFHHVAMTYNSGTNELTAYVGGSPYGAVSVVAANMDFGNSDAFIGANATNLSYSFDGVIDDVRFWNLARSQSQINTGKDSELTGSQDGLVGYWQCNELDSGMYHKTLGGFANPCHISVNSLDQSVWVAEFYGGQVTRVAKDCDRVITHVGNFSRPFATYIPPGGETVWVTDYMADKVVILSNDGTVQRTITGLSQPTGITGFLPVDSSFSSDGNGSTVHTYPMAGTYEAVLTVTDDDGNSDTDTVVIRAGDYEGKK
jgi:DNA-binding beta-propeller fold protein YncE